MTTYLFTVEVISTVNNITGGYSFPWRRVVDVPVFSKTFLGAYRSLCDTMKEAGHTKKTWRVKELHRRIPKTFRFETIVKRESTGLKLEDWRDPCTSKH